MGPSLYTVWRRDRDQRTMERDCNATNDGVSVRGFSRSMGKVEQAWEKRSEGFPRYASCAASVGTAAIGDEIRRNRSNGAITRLRSWESGER